ncbi:MAG TPA: MFS transporter [Candidatus Limnocylindrales bacterium]|nr:MFS transporter [Candidatus Limnocylindrales bacterium]
MARPDPPGGSITLSTLPTSLQETSPRPVRHVFGFPWPAQVTRGERNSLIAGGLGWMLDAMDVMLYSMVLAHLMGDLGMSKSTGGLLAGLTLGASAVGGVMFGFIADRVGRTRALMAAILVYSLASGACGLSQTVVELAICRLILGLGMGGEWTTGAALIAESWPPEHRGKALGLMQSTYAIGEMLAVGVTALVLPHYGWRAVFFVGVLPALLVFWILRSVPESEMWRARGTQQRGSIRLLWRKDIRGPGLLATAMNASAMFGYWGLFTWIPTYLSLPVALGGRGLNLMATTTWLIVMGVGKWLGYALFGFFADSAGRKTSYATYLFVAAALVPLYGMSRTPMWLLILGPPVAFFGTGFFSGYAAIASELFPTEIRATAMGLSYNFGRGISALAPFAVGAIATRYSFTAAFYVLAGAFFLSALLALALPETKGKHLE